MYLTKTFIPTLKEVPQGVEAISHKLMLRAGLVRMLTSGVYSYLPLGLKVLKKIEDIIRDEMNAIEAQELFLPCLQPLELWKKTGRDKDMDQIMIRFTDRRGREMCLGPTHEEVITDLVKNHVSSYRQLPLVLYQIQTKFRDEIRPRFGIIRACEFIMKDAYSFDRDKKGLGVNYKLMYDAYRRIFERCGLDFIISEADSGVMGGDISHEYMVPAQNGEDAILCCESCKYAKSVDVNSKEKKCPKCQGKFIKKQVLEVGHIFQLGTKYTKAQDATFIDENGNKQFISMGCYGIGVSRLIAAIIEQNHDSHGIIWPGSVSPFSVQIIPLKITNDKIMQLALKYYETLEKCGYEVLIDDRDESAGVKFKDADLIGTPLMLILGEKNIEKNEVEIKIRKSGEVLKINTDAAVDKLRELIKICRKNNKEVS